VSRSLVFPIVAAALAARLSSAHAEDPSFGSVAAAACMPTRITLESGKLDTTTWGAIQFKSGSTGSMEVTCRINPTLDPATLVRMLYAHDDDGAAPPSTGAYYVRLQVRARNKVTGAITDMCDVYSNTLSSFGSTPDCYVSPNLPDYYYYYANVTLFRNVDQAASIVFYGLTFESAH